MAMQMAMPAAGGCPGGPRVGRVRARGQLATAVPKRFSLRARALAASSSRSFGGAFVTRSSSRCLVMCAISATARSKVSWFVTDGFVAPLTLRTYCNAAAWTSSSVAGGSKLCRTLMFRHMSPGWHTPGRDSSADVTGKVHPSAGVPTNLHHDQPPRRPTCTTSLAMAGGSRMEADMKIGLHIADFTYPDGPAGLRDDLSRIVTTAEEAGFGRVSVMDHLWQIGLLGPPEHEMLEAYTTLGYLAALTSEVELVAWVTAVVYREPGMLAKLVSTLDVLSGGRAWLGIGAAWNEEEARGLGLPFPPTAERFERLEETLQICLQMWSEDDGPYEGRHYQLARTLNSPQSLRRPHPPILIGGSGEKKTLRLVAKYAQACNLFGTPEVEHKLEVLRGHCEREGRNYNDIEKTVMTSLDPGENGEHVDAILQQLQHYARLGISAAQGIVPGVWKLSPLKILGKEVVPAIADW